MTNKKQNKTKTSVLMESSFGLQWASEGGMAAFVVVVVVCLFVFFGGRRGLGVFFFSLLLLAHCTTLNFPIGNVYSKGYISR